MTSNLAQATTRVEVVCQGDAVTSRYFIDLVLTVTVEGRPLDILGGTGPVERGDFALVTHDELAAFVVAGQTYHE
jgi:hypothetical protein